MTLASATPCTTGMSNTENPHDALAAPPVLPAEPEHEPEHADDAPVLPVVPEPVPDALRAPAAEDDPTLGATGSCTAADSGAELAVTPASMGGPVVISDDDGTIG